MNIPKLVHLDMKGGPPTPSYLMALLPMLKDWGATGLLIEWEDMFPWSGTLSSLARSGHYTVQDVQNLIRTATSLHMEVIPLIQTFGHIEFVLKHKKFRHLREIPDYPNSLLPLCVDTGGEVEILLRDLVGQVVSLHGPSLNTIHLGCDEVWCLGQSDRTKSVLQLRGWSVTDVFLDHVSKVSGMTKVLKSGLNILIWDDMLRSASTNQVRMTGLDRLVRPVVWSYGPNLSLPEGLISRYRSIWGDGSVWGGSAWRGATSPNNQLPNIQHHIENTLSWLSVIRSENLAGLVLTGWSRFDHYATLCDLLPVSLPSLRCCLAIVQTGGWNGETHRAVSGSLGLSQLLPTGQLNSEAVEQPNYPGSQLYTLVISVLRLNAQHTALSTSTARDTWLNSWQLERGFLNPLQVGVTVQQLTGLGVQFRELANLLTNLLTELLHGFTADEWVNTNISPKIRDIDSLVGRVNEVIQRDSELVTSHLH